MRLKALAGSPNPLMSTIHKMIKQGDPKEYSRETSSLSKLGLDEVQALAGSASFTTPSVHCLTEAATKGVL